MKEASREAEVKAAAAKATAFLSFLVILLTDRCTSVNIVSNVHSYSYSAV